MIQFVQEVVTWWLVFLFLGYITLPITMRIFSSFFDKGYAFSKIIGLMLLAYSMYALGTLHVLPFTTWSLVALALCWMLLSYVFFAKTGNNFDFKKSWKLFLLEELVFLGGLFFWSYIKAFQPDIHGLEKFMDYGFVNSILRTTYFPTKDMWMAPLTINYYYFGHIMTAVATKLSSLPSTVTFNLMLATLFSLTLTEGFSLGANIVYRLQVSLKQKTKQITLFFVGSITAILLTFGGNLHTLYTFFRPYQNESPVPPTQLIFSPMTFPNQYWYPNATRFIFHTIHEFPIYSFVVSDLHGHVLDIPAVLLMISVLFVFTMNSFAKMQSFLFASALLGSLASIMYMTNAWDGLIYIGVGALVIFAKLFNKNFWDTLLSKKSLLTYLVLFGTFIIVSLPFSLFFKPFASEIGVNCAPQFLLAVGKIGPLIFEPGYCQISPLWQLAILYGFFFFWLISFVTFLFREQKRGNKIVPVDLFVLGMGILGFSLIIIPELVYLKDIYTTYFRANTMFKLVYQAFILLMIVSSYTIYRIFSSLHAPRRTIYKRIASGIYASVGILLITLVLLYPYFAIMSYFNGLKDFQGLNGLTYLQKISADDYHAVLWINSHIKGQPVMLEAQGDSYTDYERISANTGLPTVFGWMVHEWLWRGTYNIVPGRIADVKTLYESSNIDKTKSLLKKYHVQYVYVGDMERTKYTHLDEKKFTTLGTVVYASGNVRIYKIK